MLPCFANLLAIDLGCDGAAIVARVGNDGPEAVCPPVTWWHRNRRQYDRHRDEVHDALRLLVQDHRPRVAVIEKAVSIYGYRHVGVSQAWMGAEVGLVIGGCPRPPEMLIQVPGVSGERAAQGWAILRASFGDILSAEEMRELSGPRGEHVRDACAILVRGLTEWEGMLRGERRRGCDSGAEEA